MKRVLVANRGEIAVRIIQALRKTGIESVSVFHEDEVGSRHIGLADLAVCLGAGSLSDTYLNIPKILSVAKSKGCDAIHPGYGFLSENHSFALGCKENNLIFIGPDEFVIHSMSVKSEAKKNAAELNIPVLEGVVVDDFEEAQLHAKRYPFLIKAVAGGGGKGLKIVRSEEQFESAFKSAQHEALQYFGNGELMLEPYICEARHIEVQVFGDNYGNVVHLFERECSIQRNHQKIIEEAPAEDVSEDLKTKLYSAAIRFARSLNYSGAGTVEFLVKGNEYWFLEMNTRIQVEHPVTEMITGLDLVELQIKIARGEKLPEELKHLSPKGHAIEARVYAESPFDGFLPSIGEVRFSSFPVGARVDTFIQEGTKITPHFDSMLAKLIVNGTSRAEASEKMKKALENTIILGVKTNISYLKEIVSSSDYNLNQISTVFLNREAQQLKENYQNRQQELRKENIIPAFVFNEFICPELTVRHLWNKTGRLFQEQDIEVKIGGVNYPIRFSGRGDSFIYVLNGGSYMATVKKRGENYIRYTINDEFYECMYYRADVFDYYCFEGSEFEVSSPHILRMAGRYLKKISDYGENNINQIVSPLFGKIININVKKSDKVNKGDVLITIESMKTENHILAPSEGVIDTVHVSEGIQVKENIRLLTLSPIN